MGYPLRPPCAGVTHHVIARGNNKRMVFEEPRDRDNFVASLHAVSQRHRWAVLAYCVMGNHFHLVVRAPDPNLSSGMQILLSRYAKRHNLVTGRTGHVFGGRFRSFPIETDQHLFSVMRYVYRNPIAAGLVDRANEWPASSYAATLAGADQRGIAVSEALAVFHPNPPYARWIIDSAVHKSTDEFSSLGEAAHPPRLLRRPSPRTIVAVLGRWEGARASVERGFSQGQIAESLGVSQTTVQRWLQR